MHSISLVFSFLSNSETLEEMEMLSAFTSVLHVPNLSSPEHVLGVLEQSDIFSKGEIQAIGKKMSGKRCVKLSFNLPSSNFITLSLSLPQRLHWHQEAVGPHRYGTTNGTLAPCHQVSLQDGGGGRPRHGGALSSSSSKSRRNKGKSKT